MLGARRSGLVEAEGGERTNLTSRNSKRTLLRNLEGLLRDTPASCATHWQVMLAQHKLYENLQIRL